MLTAFKPVRESQHGLRSADSSVDNNNRLSPILLLRHNPAFSGNRCLTRAENLKLLLCTRNTQRKRLHNANTIDEGVTDLAPQVGLEPTTLRLTAECSAIELLRNNCGCSALDIALNRNGFYNKTPRAWSRRRVAQAGSLRLYSRLVV